MRGKDIAANITALSRRITLAHAGKRTFREVAEAYEKDHPRTCGEKKPGQKVNLTAEGSPPHMRGKAVLGGLPAGHVGITPAYAGKSTSVSFLKIASKDHPRICGEKTSGLVHAILLLGSPPHMRGKEIQRPDSRPDARITPAYAGKSHLGVFC